jgi:hypothetical protein
MIYLPLVAPLLLRANWWRLAGGHVVETAFLIELPACLEVAAKNCTSTRFFSQITD